MVNLDIRYQNTGDNTTATILLNGSEKIFKEMGSQFKCNEDVARMIVNAFVHHCVDNLNRNNIGAKNKFTEDTAEIIIYDFDSKSEMCKKELNDGLTLFKTIIDGVINDEPIEV